MHVNYVCKGLSRNSLKIFFIYHETTDFTDIAGYNSKRVEI